MRPHSLLLCSQKPTKSLCSEPDKFMPHSHTMCIFNTLPSTYPPFKMVCLCFSTKLHAHFSLISCVLHAVSIRFLYFIALFYRLFLFTLYDIFSVLLIRWVRLMLLDTCGILPSSMLSPPLTRDTVVNYYGFGYPRSDWTTPVVFLMFRFLQRAMGPCLPAYSIAAVSRV